MANSRLSEIQKTERLKAIYDAKKDVYGAPKVLYVYEVLKFEVKQGRRIVKKKYYNLIHKERYTFTSEFDEVVLYQRVRKILSKMTPFTLDIQLREEGDTDALVAYYNEQSSRYYDAIKNGEYERKKARLMTLYNNVNNIDNMIDFIMELNFKI